MREKLIILFVVTLFATTIKGQDTLYAYFDSSWNKTDKENSVFSRKIYKQGYRKWAVLDYYNNGNIQMKGVYKTKRAKKRSGLFTYYYKNGQIEQVGNYKKNRKTGTWKLYYKNIQINRIGDYKKGVETGAWKWYYGNGQIDKEGDYKKGVKIGTWKLYFVNGQICAELKYTDGEVVKGSYWNEQGGEVSSEKASYMPSFVGGQDALLNFLRNHTRYPEKALRNGISGEVYVDFVLDKEGHVTNVSIAKSVHPLLDQESLRVVRSMPKWRPGKQHNRFVRVMYTIPIKFTLQK